MTGKLRNYQIQVLDSLSRMEEYRKQLEAEGMTTIDGETYIGVTGRLPSFPETQRIGRATRPAPNPGSLVIVDYAAIEERLMSMAAKRKPKGKQPFKAGGTCRKWWSIGMASTAIVVARLARGQGNGEA